MSIIKKLFGKEGKEKAQDIAMINTDLRNAIDDIQKLEQDWKEKANHIKIFLENWNSKSGDLKKLKENIRIVREIEDDEEGIVKKTRAVLKIKEAIYKVYYHSKYFSSKYGYLDYNLKTKDFNPDIIEHKPEDVYVDSNNTIFRGIVPYNNDQKKLAKELHSKLTGNHETFFQKIKSLFDNEAQNWERLRAILEKQINFINTYSTADIGVVHFHINELIEYIKKEGKFLGIEKKALNQIKNYEERFREAYPQNYKIPANTAEKISAKYSTTDYNKRLAVEFKMFLESYGFDFQKNPEIGKLLMRYFREEVKNFYDTAKRINRVDLFTFCENIESYKGTIKYFRESAVKLMKILIDDFTFYKGEGKDRKRFFVPVLSIIGKFDYIKFDYITNWEEICSILLALHTSVNSLPEWTSRYLSSGLSNLKWMKYSDVGDKFSYLSFSDADGEKKITIWQMYLKLFSALDNFKNENDFKERAEWFNTFYIFYQGMIGYGYEKNKFLAFTKEVLKLGVGDASYLVWLLMSNNPYNSEKAQDNHWYEYHTEKLTGFNQLADKIGKDNIISEMKKLKPEEAFFFIMHGDTVMPWFEDKKITVAEFCKFCNLFFQKSLKNDNILLTNHYSFGIGCWTKVLYNYGPEIFIEMLEKYGGQGNSYSESETMKLFKIIYFLADFSDTVSKDKFMEDYGKYQNYISPISINTSLLLKKQDEIKLYYTSLFKIMDYMILLHSKDISSLFEKFFSNTIISKLHSPEDFEAYADIIDSMISTVQDIPDVKTVKEAGGDIADWIKQGLEILKEFAGNSNLKSMKDIRDKSTFKEVIFWIGEIYYYEILNVSIGSGFKDLIPKFANIYDSNVNEFEKFKKFFVFWQKKLGKDKIIAVFMGLYELKDLWQNNLNNLKKIAAALVVIVRTFGNGDIKESFKSTISSCKETIKIFGVSEIAKIANACNKGKAENVFIYGLPACKDLIKTKEDLLEVGLILVKIANACNKDNTQTLFESGIKNILSKENLLETGMDLVVMGDKIKNKDVYLTSVKIFAILAKLADDKPSIKKTAEFTEWLGIKFPKYMGRYLSSIKILVEKKLIKETSDLKTLYHYLSEFHILDEKLYEKYITVSDDKTIRTMWLRNYKAKYKDIIWGKEKELEEIDYPLVVYAVNSSKLEIGLAKETLLKYSKEVENLKTKFTNFTINISKVEWEMGKKMDDGLLKQTQQIFEKIAKDKIPFEGKDSYLIGLQKMFNLGEDVVYNAALKELKEENDAFPFTLVYLFQEGKISTFKQERLAWQLLLNFGYRQSTRDEVKKALLDITDSSDPGKLRGNIESLLEFLNDTIKDVILPYKNEDNEKIIDNILILHRKFSNFDKLATQVKKFAKKGGNQASNIDCVPSKKPLDLFFGFFGENCTSDAPEALLRPEFTPVRMIVDEEILGCIHFYEYNNMLLILGIEPKESLMNQYEPSLFLDRCMKAFIQQAKDHGLNKICLPNCGAMISNRQTLANEMDKLKNGKKELPDPNIAFPGGTIRQYTTGKLYVVWEE